VNVHSAVPGVRWAQVWANKAAGELRGVETFFAGIDDLIAMKEAAARPGKDRPDVARLRQLKNRML